MKEIGIYVHIPFCKQKCYYCDFKSYANKERLIEEYIKWLKYEIKEVGTGNKLDYENGLDDLVFVKTIYIGGGTPSYIDSKYIKEIIEEIKTNFKVSKDTEVTIEINPGTVDKQKLLDYMKSGINRVSIGLQSTDDDILRKIGRIHKYDDFLQTYNMAREVGFKNINVDLMLALPGQTVPKLKQGLKQIIALKPEHISLYSLILEEGTVLNKKVQNKEIELPGEDDERKMYPSFSMINVTAPASISPLRVPIIKPSNGVSPIVVSIHLPSLIAAIEPPLPMWQVIIFFPSGFTPRNSHTRFDT